MCGTDTMAIGHDVSEHILGLVAIMQRGCSESRFDLSTLHYALPVELREPGNSLKKVGGSHPIHW